MAINLFVGNLPYSMTSDDMAQVFAGAGTVVSAKVISDKYSGRSRGFGFVTMTDDAEAEKAINAMNGVDLDGRKLTVNEARPLADRPPRQERSGGYNSRGGDRGSY